MPHHSRLRGARWELRVKHKLLPRPFYATFATQVEADSYGQQLDAMLDRGIVPAELLAGEPRAADDPRTPRTSAAPGAWVARCRISRALRRMSLQLGLMDQGLA